MKVALCLHGLASGKNYKHGGLDVSFESESSLFKKHIIEPNEADVFIHSWSIDSALDIDKIYDPLKSVYEPSKKFVSPSLRSYLVDFRNRCLFRPRELSRLNNIYSRWYSLAKVVGLMREYELENDVEYDYVMVSRFDLSWFAPLDFSRLASGAFVCPDWRGYRGEDGEVIDESKAYNSNRRFSFQRGFPANDEGVLDFWFISPSSLMVEFAKIFPLLDQLVSIEGESNHKIALRRIAQMGALDRLEFFFRSTEAFCLSRWMK